MRAWVIGSGGLLGHAIVREARFRERQSGVPLRIYEAPRIPWSDEAQAIRVLEEQVGHFAAGVGLEPWVIFWAAGSSIVASDETQTRAELRIFTALTAAISTQLPAQRGTLFVTSSAGGVFAGGAQPPFSAASQPMPISPYGRLKLSQESQAITVCAPMCSVVIGRFSNLYGPARDKEKQQGLIQRLCTATMKRTAINLYVSMDTVRDYLFIDDAARLAWDAVEATSARPEFTVDLLLLASGEGSSIAEVIATVQSVTHRRVPLALGSDPSSERQVIDLRFTPSLSAEQMANLTPLPIGVRRVFDSILGGVA
jgi:UDP-glucose 4-epimerase